MTCGDGCAWFCLFVCLFFVWGLGDGSGLVLLWFLRIKGWILWLSVIWRVEPSTSYMLSKSPPHKLHPRLGRLVGPRYAPSHSRDWGERILDPRSWRQQNETISAQRRAGLGYACCDPSTWEMKAGESGVQVQPGLNETPFQKIKQTEMPSSRPAQS